MIKKKQLLVHVLLLIFPWFSAAQFTADVVLSGPMTGAVSDSSVYVWLLLEEQSKTSSIDIVLKNQSNNTVVSGYTIANSYCMGDTCSYLLNFSGLNPGGNYRAIISINSIPTDSSGIFITDDSQLPDVEFLIGGCNLMHDPGDTYGTSSSAILNIMRQDPADFMLWTGDVFYHRYNSSGFPGLEYNDTSKMFARWVKSRTHSVKRAFKQSKFQLATWDDHDFGPNNAGSDYAYRDFSINMFKNFWGNGTYPQDGVYNTYKYRDLQFFLTDNRSFQTQQDYLGRTQLEWLKAELMNSSATFKFIVIPSAVLWSWQGTSEISMYQSGERDELYDFIYYNNISGVIFLSGDKHKSYFARYDPGCGGTYPLYEFMSSPMTSGLSSNVPDYPDMIYFYTNYSYGKVRISGLAVNRVCTFEMKNASGTIVSTLAFSENDLQPSFSGPVSTSSNVVADYNFEGNANDSTASAYHATVTGPVLSTNRFATANGSYEFDSYPETIDFPNATLNGRSDFTVSFWIYPTGNSSNGLVSAASATSGNEFLIFNDNGQIDFWIKNTKAEFDYTISLNKWQHIVATRNGTTGEGKIYVDGIFIGSAVFPTGAMNVSSNALIFGNDQDDPGGGGLSSSQQFEGLLDHLTFYDIALCQYQIREVFKENFSVINKVYNDTLCQAGSAEFKVSGSLTNNYNWYENETALIPVSGQTDSSYNILIDETTTFWVAANNIWSESPRHPVTVFVSPEVYTDSVTFPGDLTAGYSFDSNANDESGNGYHATLNGPTPAVGYLNGSYEFDNYLETIEIPHQTLNGATHFTISFWINTTSGQDGILSAAGSAEANELMIYLKSGGDIELYIHNDTKLSAKTSVSDGNWHHVLVKANTTEGTSWIYIDGEAQPTLVGYHQRGKLEIVPGGLVLGNDQDTPGGGGFDPAQQLMGKLDELKIYRRLLDETEIKALYSGSNYFKRPLRFIATDSVCAGDSAQLMIFNPQYNVQYNIFDDSNLLLGTYSSESPLDSVLIPIGPFNSTTNLNIVANSTSWSCQELTDSSSQVYVTQSATPDVVFTAPDTLCSNIIASDYYWWLNGLPLSDSTQCIQVSANGNYEVLAVVNNCPSDTSVAYWYTTGSGQVNENSSEGITLYPNPAKEGRFNIDLPRQFNQIHVRVLSLLGKTIKSVLYNNSNQLTFYLDAPPGCYIAEIKADEYLFVVKVINK
jgi:alkaline phosphatase D